MTLERRGAEQERNDYGTLYGVGLGPGAPDLLTLRAVRVLRTCPTLCVPASADGHSFAWEILRDVVDPQRQEILWARYPMQRGSARLAPRQVVAQQVLGALCAGRDVAFVTEGDPMLYSTFGHLLIELRQRAPALRIEIVPGVASPLAGAALAQVPLALEGERVAVLPALYLLETGTATLPAIFDQFETLVLLKVNRVFERVLDLLESAGLAQSTVYVRRVGTAQQAVVTDVRTLRGQSLDYFSLLIVRNFHATRRN